MTAMQSADRCALTFGPHSCRLPAGHRGMHCCPLTCAAFDHDCIRTSSCQPGDHTGSWPCEMAVNEHGEHAEVRP